MDRNAFARVQGVGKQKCRDYWRVFCTAIREHLEDTGQAAKPSLSTGKNAAGAQSPQSLAYALFEEETAIEDVCRQLGRNERWVLRELESFLRETGRATPYPWVDENTFSRVADAAEHVIGTRIKSIRQFAGEDLSDTAIRLSLACLRNR